MQFTAYRSAPVLLTQLIQQAYPAVALFFPEAVELRLRKISGSLAKDIVTAAQFTIFTLQLFQTLTFSGGEPTSPHLVCAPGMARSAVTGAVLQLWWLKND
ncbi:hypothetical protein IEJ43_004590 [Escherichia coli]|nr:hypothetical protein [Escherichia coli]EGH4617081.1 hypothetical protein [Escherichia coli]